MAYRRNTDRRAALGPGQARTAREGRSATGGIAESPCGRTEGEITHEVLLGDPAAVLEAAARDASLVVLGRHRQEAGDPRRDKVVRRLMRHSACPMLVVDATADSTAPVLVAVDASASAGEAVEAMECAFAEASARGVSLLVLRRRLPWSAQARGASVAAELPGLRRRFPDVAVCCLSAQGWRKRPWGTTAQLVVLAGHGSAGTPRSWVEGCRVRIPHVSVQPVAVAWWTRARPPRGGWYGA
ncbi:universal stress protein [Streptomyces calvus]|uniref:universal stress protein n=1 Tax=Streptomyces TaxID=1883 RepID=UPI00115412A0|nr:universal stress protein [Streptomyces sp. SID7804]